MSPPYQAMDHSRTNSHVGRENTGLVSCAPPIFEAKSDATFENFPCSWTIRHALQRCFGDFSMFLGLQGGVGLDASANYFL